MITQAVILAGGKGKRLLPLTKNLPKPMVLVGGKPFAAWLVALLKNSGIQEIIFLLGYLPEKVQEYFGDGSRFGVHITYSVGSVEENNGTRIRNAAHLLQNKFLLLYGDIYWPLDLKMQTEFYEKLGLPVMMTVYDNSRGDGEYKKGNVEVRDGIVTHYGEFRDNLVFRGLDIGYSIVDASALQMMPKKDFEFQREFLRPLIEKKMVSGFVTKVLYHTITDVDFLRKTEKHFQNIEDIRRTKKIEAKRFSAWPLI